MLYWIEYVARNHGAKFVKTNRRISDQQTMATVTLLFGMAFAGLLVLLLPCALIRGIKRRGKSEERVEKSTEIEKEPGMKQEKKETTEKTEGKLRKRRGD